MPMDKTLTYLRFVLIKMVPNFDISISLIWFEFSCLVDRYRPNFDQFV